MLEEFAHLAAALADQRDHRDIDIRAFHQHAHQRRLAAARGGEDAHALPLAAGQQAIERPHPERQRLVDQATLQRVRRLGEHRIEMIGHQRAVGVAVDRAAESVQHAPEQAVADRHHVRAARRHDLGRVGNAVHVPDRGQQRGIARETDDFGLHLQRLSGALEQTQLADGDRGDHGLDDGSDHLRHAPANRQRRGLLQGHAHHLGDVVELAHRVTSDSRESSRTRRPRASIWPSSEASTVPISVSTMHASPRSRVSGTRSRYPMPG